MKPSEEQMRFIAANAQNVGCVAGPGSGKTASIIARARRMAAEGKRVHVITYTNKAADEIAERVAADDGEPITASTIHRFCLKWLGLDREVIESQHVYGIMIDLMRGQLNCRWTSKQIKDARFQFHRSSYGGTPPAKPLVALWARLEAFLETQGVIDQDGILMAFDRKPRADIDALFLDEAQDANALVWRVFRKCCKPGGWPILKTAVADPNQSIFGFIQSDKAHHFSDFLKSAEVFELRDNYRSDREIVRFSNGLQSARSVARSEAAGSVQARVFESIDEETAAIMEWASVTPADHAILCRTNRVVDAIGDVLRAAGLPIKGDKIEAPKGWWAFKEFLKIMQDRGNKAKTLVYLAQLDCYSTAELSDLMRRAKLAAEPLLDQILEPGLTLCSAYAKMMQIAGYRDPEREIVKVLTECTDSAEIALFDAEQLEKTFVTKGDPDGMTISTIHKAKGLQWPSVWIPAIDSRWSSFGHKVDRDEEQRIFYVGVTRAKHDLNLSSCDYEVLEMLTGRAPDNELDPGDRVGAFRND